MINDILEKAKTRKMKKKDIVFCYMDTYLTPSEYWEVLKLQNETDRNNINVNRRIDNFLLISNIDNETRYNTVQRRTTSNLICEWEKYREKKKPFIVYLRKVGDSVKVIKTFDNLESAKVVGIIVNISKVKSMGEDADGYFWSTYNNAELLYPEELQEYIESLEDNRFILRTIKEDSYSEERKLYSFDPIVCYLGEKNIAFIYENLEDLVSGEFDVFQILSSINTNYHYSQGYYWDYLSRFPINKIEEYKQTINRGNIQKPLLIDETQIVKCDSGSKDILEIYPNLSYIEKISNKTLTDLLQNNTENREYKGYSWYRVLEYLDLYPDRWKDISQILKTKKEDTKTELHLLLTVSSKLISVNELYKARVAYTGSGRPYPILYKNPKAQKVSDEVRNQLLALDLKGYKPWLENTKKYSININFILKSGINRRDCANFEKIMCDDLTRFIRDDLEIKHFDDSEFFECNFVKSICPDAKNEYAYIILKESFFEDRIDIVDKPEKIYLSEINEHYWNNKFSEIYDKEIYNPEVNIWDKNIRNYEKTVKCNTELIIVSPGELSEENTFKIIDKINNSNGKFIFISVLGELNGYDKAEIQRLGYLNKFSKKEKVYTRNCKSIKEITKWLQEYE